jgi:hypothetical protein
MNQIIRLQKWYKSQCNDDWEHHRGVVIRSCDNPGWWVQIELAGTTLETKPFSTVERNVSAKQMERISKGLEPDMCNRGPDWMLCQVKENTFDGAGDSDKLEDILKTFLDWVENK